MPIYAYKCESCGHAKDVLQKMSDAPLVDCPQCGAATFKKQLTSAGFQLKGSGWYVTDFRDGKGGADKAKASGESDKAAPSATATDSVATPAKTETATSSAAPVAAPAPSPAPVPKATP
ncbi:MAG: zinc ribbon domain-containing protein [Vitreoscilla sp.]|nr:zinc ribbon domain-containing protein [Polaromonas sp.]